MRPQQDDVKERLHSKQACSVGHQLQHWHSQIWMLLYFI